VLVLRTCDADMKAHGGFVWPKSGLVEAPDWQPTKACGNGLHGLLWGRGDYTQVGRHDTTAIHWLVVRVAATDIVDLDGKVKFPCGEVVYCGDLSGATAMLDAEAPPAPAGAEPAREHASGDLGQATASGGRGQATASGDLGQATASGYLGQATASGYLGQATASGYRGQATASGDRGQATHTGKGVAMGLGADAVVSGKDGACLVCTWWDDAANRPRVVVGYVGEDGIKADTWYRADGGKLVETTANVT
jgi:hypothetical protein